MFVQLKVALAPCVEGLILLDRLCYLKEQVKILFSLTSGQGNWRTRLTFVFLMVLENKAPTGNPREHRENIRTPNTGRPRCDRRLNRAAQQQ